MSEKFSIGQRVRFTSISMTGRLGRQITLSSREGVIVELSKPTGQKALVKKKNGRKEWFRVSKLQALCEQPALNKLLEILSDNNKK